MESHIPNYEIVLPKQSKYTMIKFYIQLPIYRGPSKTKPLRFYKQNSDYEKLYRNTVYSTNMQIQKGKRGREGERGKERERQGEISNNNNVLFGS